MPKDVQPTFQLEATTLLLANRLPTVSEKIPSQKQNVKLLNKPNQPAPDKPQASSSNFGVQTIIEKGIQKIQWLLAFILGLIVLITGLVVIQTNRKRRQARRNRGRR